MKKTAKILCVLLIVALIAIIIISNNANAQTAAVSSSSATVESGDIFEVTIEYPDIGEFGGVSGYLSYNKELFSYVEDQNMNKLFVGTNMDNQLNFMYYDFDAATVISKITLKFKAIGTSGSGNFEIVSSEVQDSEGKQYPTITGGSTTVTIKETPVATDPAPVLDTSTANIKVGETKNINVTNKDSITNGVTWSSSDESKVTVSNGTITGVAEGDATITAKSEGGTATINVHVSAADNGDNPSTSGVVLSKTNVTLAVGGTETITANKQVTWFSTDTGIVTVDSNGKLTGIAEGGPVTVIATDANSNAATVTVTVTATGNNQGGGDNNNGNQNNGGENNNGNNSENNNGNNNGNSNSGNGSQNGTSTGTQGSTNNSATGNSATGGATTTNTSSSANEVVPATGETSTGTIVILVIVTLIVASVIFKKNSRIK